MFNKLDNCKWKGRVPLFVQIWNVEYWKGTIILSPGLKRTLFPDTL